MAGRRIVIEFLGKDTSVGKTAAGVEGKLRGAGKAADESGKRFGKAGLGIKKLVGAFAGFAVVSKATSFLKESVAEAREAQKVGALTTQVIKTTGGAAKVTAKHVADLATAISNKAGIDDEAIQTGANLLLTFKNIRNESGKGNKIFDQTTKIMTDMGAAMGKEPKAAAIQLGKALNDPIKGITALSKVGVTFDDKQKKTIAHMVKTGNVMGAQKVILKELKSEFGGAAAASSTAGEKAAVAWGNLKEQIGTALLPILDKLEGWFSKKIIPAVSKFFSEMQSGEGTGGKVVDILKDLGDTLGKVFGFLVHNKAAVATFIGVLAGFQILTSIRNAWIALNIAMEANPIGLVVVAIAALAAGLVYAYKHSETFRKIVNGAFKAVADAGKFMWEKVLKPTFKFLINAWLAVAGAIVHGAANAFGWVPGLGPKLKAAARNFDTFKERVNNQINGIHDAKIKITTPGAPKAISNLSTIKGLMHDITHAKPGKHGSSGGGGPLTQLFPTNARGTSNWGGGPTWVGERGPEIVSPPAGSRIYPAAQSARMAGRGGGSTVVNLNFNGLTTDPVAVGREVRKALLALEQATGKQVLVRG